MHVTSFHETEHLARVAAHSQGFAVKLTGEGIKRHNSNRR
jgi:hypothetical protein